MTDELLSTNEAAEFLGLSVATVKYHIYTSKQLVPDAKIGKTLVFRRSTLEAFQKTKRGPGRPPAG